MAIAMCSDHKKVLDLLAPDEDGGYGISEKNIPADLKSPLKHMINAGCVDYERHGKLVIFFNTELGEEIRKSFL